MLLLGFAFVGGAIWTMRGSSTSQPIPKIRFLDVAFQSTPVGAEVYIVGSNEYLGRTPFRRKVEYRDDRTSFVVFRLPGYLETTREVRPEWPGDVTLQPQPVVPPPIAPPPTVAPAPTEAPTPKHIDQDVDPFEKMKPNKSHARPHGKAGVRGGDALDRLARPKDVRKASPFD